MEDFMKKRVSLMLACLMLLSVMGLLSACTANEEPTTSSTPAPTPTPTQMDVTKVYAIVQGYEWGPAVPKIVLEFPEDVSGFANDTFEVKFGTTKRTRSNAEILARELGADFLEVNIGKAVEQHFADIGQSMEDHSVTFENGQARERTQVLMDLANQRGGLVIGTGDLSELALGWATYNGDHMSMYAVNASIPKTLVRHLVAWEAQRRGGPIGEVLRDILDTPVSPELLPPKDGEIAQKTEDLVGPYELHDFFLYYAVRWGFPPRKVLRLAACAFGGRYDREALLKWLKNFYRRFFSQQFKRSCLPDGPKVGSVGLSPRGDWRMPSDAAAKLWLDELEELL